MFKIKGCLHEKTRTGASFIPGWLFDFETRLHDDWVHISLFESTLHVDKIHGWFKIANITHALPVPVYRQTDFTPKRVVVYMIQLRDFVSEWNSRPGTRTVVNSSEGDSRRHGILRWYRVSKYRAMRGNRSKLAPVSCKHPLTQTCSYLHKLSWCACSFPHKALPIYWIYNPSRSDN